MMLYLKAHVVLRGGSRCGCIWRRMPFYVETRGVLREDVWRCMGRLTLLYVKTYVTVCGIDWGFTG